MLRSICKSLAISILGWSLSASADIALIGRAADGSESVRSVPSEAYARALRDTVAGTHEAVLPELACTQDAGTWKLHTVGVGVSLTATLGLGPLISVQANPTVLLLYTRAKEPIFPITTIYE